MQFTNEFREKHSRIIKLLDQEKLDGVVLSTQANFAWFTCGGDNHVAVSGDAGVAHVVVTREKVWVICENIEAPRIENEEVGQLGIPVIAYNWWEGKQKDVIEQLVGNANYGSDMGIFGSRNVEPAIAPLRYSLTSEEIERYRWVGKNVAGCMDIACRQIEPGMTEHEIAGILNKQLISRGLIPQVTLIAADERISKYRHPVPTDNKVDRYVMVVTGSRRWGLVTSMSRLVHFGKLPDELIGKHKACVRVDAAFIHATRPGNAVSDIFNKGVEAYAEGGYPGEWTFHHQGGPTGYKGRDFRGAPNVQGTVQPNQAYAWNPSISGTKSEDTIIATPDNTEIISEIEGWPMIEVRVDGTAYRRPDILVR